MAVAEGDGLGGVPLRVFVYGTLKPGGRYWPTYCQGRVGRVEPARVCGALFDLPAHGYPAMVDAAECALAGFRAGWVFGMLLEVPRPLAVEALAGFDRLEGYVPGRASADNEYQRRPRLVSSPGFGCGAVAAWVYVMAPARVRRMGGEWLPAGCW